MFHITKSKVDKFLIATFLKLLMQMKVVAQQSIKKEQHSRTIHMFRTDRKMNFDHGMECGEPTLESHV